MPFPKMTRRTRDLVAGRKPPTPRRGPPLTAEEARRIADAVEHWRGGLCPAVLPHADGTVTRIKGYRPFAPPPSTAIT